jgi:hypothetical protein
MQYKLGELELYYSHYLQIANDLRKYCRTHHKEDYYLLKSIPGIGGYLAAAILAELGDIRRFSNEREFSSYIGMVPGMYESAGKNSNNRITPRCRSLIRSYLVEAAWVTLRHDPEMQHYYRKHVGKNSKTVIIKIAHKLVKRILSVIKNKKPYVVNHTLHLDETLLKELPAGRRNRLIKNKKTIFKNALKVHLKSQKLTTKHRWCGLGLHNAKQVAVFIMLIDLHKCWWFVFWRSHV